MLFSLYILYISAVFKSDINSASTFERNGFGTEYPLINFI